jgi:hypothetical protein
LYQASGGGYVDLQGDPVTGDAAASVIYQTFVVVCQSGATSARPTNPSVGLKYLDTTLGYVVVFDGANWRNPATAASI